MRSRRVLLLGTLLLLSLVPGRLEAVAQDACPLDPVTLPLFDATPAAEIPGALATPAAPDDPGREATEEEITQFSDAINVLLSCINTGEGPLVFAIFTDRYLASGFADGDAYQPDLERTIAEYGSGLPGEPLVLENVDNVRVRDDGRMSGQVVLASGEESWRDTLVLAQVGDYWLIDDVIRESR